MEGSPVQPVMLRCGHLTFGRICRIAFQRTLRVPAEGVWPLPPTFGAFPIFRVKQFASRLPPAWRARGGYFIPLYQREALWISFDSAPDTLCAVQIGAGGVNVVSGRPFEEPLSNSPQNYLVIPEQPWLDGILAGEEVVRQFVAAPVGSRATVESQITGTRSIGGMQIRVYPSRPGLKPIPSPPRALSGAMGMGIAPGGRITQKIYPDRYGLDAWDTDRHAEAFVHLLNSAQFRRVTGLAPPPSPISARTYLRRGFPWFRLYDERRGHVEAPEDLARLKPAP
jgi:hypothetical protein